MGNLMDVKIHGARELERRLKQLGDPKASSGVLARSLYREAARIRDAARQLAPMKTGALRKGIKASRRTYRRRGEVKVIVRSTAPHGHLIEYGTAPRYQAETGRYTGHVNAHPFMRPAWESHRRGAVERIMAEAMRQLERAAK